MKFPSSPAEDEESTNTATMQPVLVTHKTKPFQICQEEVFSVQNKLKQDREFISVLVVLAAELSIMQ